MSVQLQFFINFKSDWHINAGYSIEGLTDAAIERGPDGVPQIPASSLKGLFWDALYELGRLPYLGYADPAELPNSILGRPGIESEWTFDPARPEGLEQLTSLHAVPGVDWAHVKTGVRVDPFRRSAEQGKYYQHELGSAALTMVFNVEGPENHEEIEWLVAASRMIRRLGGRRRRGAGECELRCKDWEKFLDAFELRHILNTHPNELALPVRTAPDQTSSDQIDANRFRILIWTESPMVIAKKAEAGNLYQGMNSVPGRTLRGALAALAEPNKFGAYEDDQRYQKFAELFIFGGMSLSNLIPLTEVGSNDKYQPFDSLPLGLVEHETTGEVISTLYQPDFDFEDYRSHSGMFSMQEKLPEVKDEAYDRRMRTRAHTRIHPETKRAFSGDLYAYEAVPSGRHFVGELKLSDNVSWNDVSHLLRIQTSEPFTIRLGKGRRRGYGKCQVWIEPLGDEPPTWMRVPLEQRLASIPEDEGQYWLSMTAMSDLIMIDQWGRAVTEFTDSWLRNELGCEVKIQEQATKSTVIDGFNTHAGLPEWRDIGIAKGSTVLFAVNCDPLEDGFFALLSETERNGIGLRRGEGFGRIVFNHPGHTQLPVEFAAPLTIPSMLRPVDSPGLLISKFEEDWQQKMSAEDFPISEKTPEYREVARILLQEQFKNAHDASARLQHLGEPHAKIAEALPPHQRSARTGEMKSKPQQIKPHVIEHIIELLHELEQYGEDYWNRGLHLLAATISEACQPPTERNQDAISD